MRKDGEVQLEDGDGDGERDTTRSVKSKGTDEDGASHSRGKLSWGWKRAKKE